MVNVHSLMKPAKDVAQCYPSDTIEKALTLTMGDVAAIVVLHEHGMKHIPVGLVTKTDLLQAYKDRVPLDHKIQEIMSRTIEIIPETASKDAAAEHFKKTHHHHAFVVDSQENQQWTGVLTIFDVFLGMAREERAWPWSQGAVDYFVAHSSPHMRKKILQHPQQHPAKTVAEVEPHSFLGIAGFSDEFSSPVSPASIKKDVKTKPNSTQNKPKVDPHTFLDIAGSTE